MNPIHFDAVLKNALAEALLDEYADVISNAEKQNFSFSEKYLKQKQRLLQNLGYLHQKQNRYAKVINIVAFASLILLMAMAGGAALLP